MYCRFASRKTTFKFPWFSQESDCTDFKTPTNRGFCAMFTPKLPIQFHEHVNETVCISNLYIYIHCITVWKTEFNRLPNRKSCFLVCATPKKKSRCTFGVKEEESLHEKYRAAFAKLEVLFVNGDVSICFWYFGRFFCRMRIVFILEFCRSSNYMFSSHRWDY